MKRAIADYTQAIKIDPDAYEEKGDFNRARADYQKALELDPNHELARNNLNALGDRGR